ncbi:MAG TPA: hypothetical protein VMV79_01050 [Alphaproteobacteria bacterium]|nr:hypothetical protein [Alphaproteobacteria bacterium]
MDELGNLYRKASDLFCRWKTRRRLMSSLECVPNKYLPKPRSCYPDDQDAEAGILPWSYTEGLRFAFAFKAAEIIVEHPELAVDPKIVRTIGNIVGNENSPWIRAFAGCSGMGTA